MILLSAAQKPVDAAHAAMLIKAAWGWGGNVGTEYLLDPSSSWLVA